jgi:hypothetical protein
MGSRCRFVQPDIVRLTLSDGDFIDVKKELNAGEQRRLFAHMMRDMVPGEKVTLIPEQVGRTKLIEYVVGWSFTDADGKPVPVSESAIDNLNTTTYAEMVKAVDDHEAAQEAKREQEKNSRDGESASSAISASPSDVTGVTNGSLN